ncbi:YciI family protein [Kitasatospora sp. NPDC101183]|uniref:YciI family protein n=1 Tax=Kitasatospora sp. NPDC101183 TaxID=3364100 RepID=UPI0037F3E24D
MAYYAVEYLFTPDKRHHEVRPAHREYLTDLQKAGSLVLSGPLTSDTGGLLIFQAADEAEIRELLAADPYAHAQVLADTRVQEWNPLLGYLAEHLKG